MAKPKTSTMQALTTGATVVNRVNAADIQPGVSDAVGFARLHAGPIRATARPNATNTAANPKLNAMIATMPSPA